MGATVLCSVNIGPGRSISSTRFENFRAIPGHQPGRNSIPLSQTLLSEQTRPRPLEGRSIPPLDRTRPVVRRRLRR